MEAGNACPICRTDIRNDRAFVTLPCEHRVHYACAARAYSSVVPCLVCRATERGDCVAESVPQAVTAPPRAAAPRSPGAPRAETDIATRRWPLVFGVLHSGSPSAASSPSTPSAASSPSTPSAASHSGDDMDDADDSVDAEDSDVTGDSDSSDDSDDSDDPDDSDDSSDSDDPSDTDDTDPDAPDEGVDAGLTVDACGLGGVADAAGAGENRPLRTCHVGGATITISAAP